MKKKLFFLFLLGSFFIVGCGNQKIESTENNSRREAEVKEMNGKTQISNDNNNLPTGNNDSKKVESGNSTTVSVPGSTANKAELEKMQKQLEASADSLNSLDENQVLE